MLLSSEYPTRRPSCSKKAEQIPPIPKSPGINLSSWSLRYLVGHRAELSGENPCAWWCVYVRLQKLETYQEYKEAASAYQEAWNVLRKQAFGSWIRNPPEYHQFKWEGKTCEELTVAEFPTIHTGLLLPLCWTKLSFPSSWIRKKVRHLPERHISSV